MVKLEKYHFKVIPLKNVNLKMSLQIYHDCCIKLKFQYKNKEGLILCASIMPPLDSLYFLLIHKLFF
jgi:hypothetical protein